MDEIVEHAARMSGGGMHVRATDPEIEQVYPLAKWIEHQQRHGTVYRRRVIVVEDWKPVPQAGHEPAPA